jgi:hypothetical protein
MLMLTGRGRASLIITAMRKVGYILLLIICSLLSEPVAASAQKVRKALPFYYEDYGACPFECCTYRRWTVNADTIIYQDRVEGARAAFRVKKGEHVMGLTGIVITLKPGKAVVKKATQLGLNGHQVRVKAGDVLYLLHYEGEGIYKFWFGGRIYEAEMPSAPDQVSQSPADKRLQYIQLVSEPQTVWWVKVRNERGQTGWSKQDDHFGDMDACG